jgi:LuxR family transcriptional regulator, maltose regulon positive regulatory protein
MLDSPLILTKLRVPALRLRTVHRTHLLELLTPEPSSLILVCAPAGYGKTTLLAEWSQSLLHTGAAIAWYALDPGDDNPSLFGAYLVASLSQALGPTSELAAVAQLLRSAPEIDLQRVLPGVINAAVSSGRDCLLVLDDYHQISTPTIHAAVAFLLERLPENMHIVIGSRSDPPLPLARLRARGRLKEIRSAELRFTPDETAQFLNEVMRLGLPAEFVTALEASTEGWIAGLQLAALSLSGRADRSRFLSSFAGSNRYLVEYLLQEVVDRQPAEVQSFLLSTSILERLCGPLCDAILADSSGSAALLERLEQTNLFVVPLDEQGYWYRYHHLFRDFLRARLNKTEPERVAALHRAASQWHESQGLLREAVTHALETRDWAYAADLVERHGMAMLMHSEISTVYNWCSAFPEPVMPAHPMLCILQAWTLVLGYRGENRGRIEERLQQAEHAAAALVDEQHGRWLAGQAAVVRTFLGLIPDGVADPRDELALAERALDLLPPDDPLRSTTTLTIGYAHMALHDAQRAYDAMEEAKRLALAGHNYYGVVEAAFHQARLAHSQGQLGRAAEICRQSQERISAVVFRPEGELPAVGCLDIALGCVLLEQNKPEQAERALLHGLDVIGWGMNPYYQMTACVALYRLREIQDLSAEALPFLSRLDETWPDIRFCTDALRVVNNLRSMPEDAGALEDATQWCQAFSASLGDDVPPGMGPLGGAEAYYIAHLARARVQIAAGKAQAALAYLVRQLALAEAYGLTHRLIEISLLEAQARHAVGEDRRAWEALERALVAAQPAGYLRSFDQGPALSRLLVAAGQRGLARDYIREILAVIGPPAAVNAEQADQASLASKAGGPSQSSRLESAEALSERELEVLHLMAVGASNQVIAEQLVITVGTVKSHINHILVKLDAHNRTEAVARARAIGMLKI